MAIRATWPRLFLAKLRARALACAVRTARWAARMANGSRERRLALFEPPDAVRATGLGTPEGALGTAEG
jgi:hypothetical protein